MNLNVNLTRNPFPPVNYQRPQKGYATQLWKHWIIAIGDKQLDYLT